MSSRTYPYDAIIVGTGPSGLFTALELISKKPRARLLFLEKGPDLHARIHPKGPADLISGWGGAGAFSDGKLNLTPEIGGNLLEYMRRAELETLIAHVDRFYRRFGAPARVYGGDREAVRTLSERATVHGLRFIPSRIRHLGTDRCFPLLKRIRQFLRGKVEIRFGEEVRRVLTRRRRVVGVQTASGERLAAGAVVLAPGRGHADWLEAEAKRLGLTTLQNPVDIGVRVEIPAAVLEPVTSVVYESKFLYTSSTFKDAVRTFCMNPYGEVIQEIHDSLITVNGHSYSRRRSENTNFAILVSTVFTEPFHEPVAFGKFITRLANMLGERVIIQRLGDLQMGRRSTPERIRMGRVRPTLSEATPGDLSFVIPYRFLRDILEMLEVLDKVAPGINSTDTLLYGVEVKFYSLRLKLTSSFEAEVAGLFAVGDGAGVSRGLIQASASGAVAAREIAKRL